MVSGKLLIKANSYCYKNFSRKINFGLLFGQVFKAFSYVEVIGAY